MFQMNPLEILTLVLLLLVVAGCVLLVGVALRWLRRIGLQQEQAGVATAQADLARAQAEAARREAHAHDAKAEREAADARRADEDAALLAAKTRLTDVSVQHVEARIQWVKDDAERVRAETQRTAADEECSRAEARRAEAETSRAEAEVLLAEADVLRAQAETRQADAGARIADAEVSVAEADARLADAQAHAVRGGMEGGDAYGSGLFVGRNGSGSPVDGSGAGPLGPVGRFLPGHGMGSDWNDSLAELSDVLGNWGGKAGRGTSTSGFPIDPRLLDLLPEDARKLLGGLKRPEDAEALFEWLRARFGDPSRRRRRGPGTSRRPAGFQPGDPDSDVAGDDSAEAENGESGTGADGARYESGAPGDEGGRGSAAPPAGLWVEDDAEVGKASHADRSDKSGEPDKPGKPGEPDKLGRADGRSADGARSAEDRESGSGAEQVSDGGPEANAGSSWSGPWTGGLDVDALIEEALRVRHLYEHDRQSRRRRGDSTGVGEPDESQVTSESGPSADSQVPSEDDRSAESQGVPEGEPSADAGSEQPGGESPGTSTPADDDPDDAPDGSSDGDD
ncbi:hypothetical protein [Brevibacterium yomogidense]|uniref:hypothetical protein n=1 Tax=Brevibacterium yomogidense TaxID=946573 RepID=UPI0018DFE2E9|nr:hypothetical protein [Brevibacterium yomogidense]